MPGLGSTPGEWEAVVAALPPDVAVIVVDPADAPRLRSRDDWTPEAVAARLAARVARAARPLLLVGHSSGGLQVQALLYAGPARPGGPGDCGGALLVDASHEQGVRLAPAPVSRVGRAVAELVLASGIATLVGPWTRALGVRLASVRGRDRMTPAAVRAFASRAWAASTLDAWFGHGPLQAGVLARQRERGAPEVPVRLLVGAAGAGRGRARWVALQRDLARRLGAPEPQLLDDAGHLVTIDRPDAIADAVRALLGAGEAPAPGPATARA
ncbi:alpha/beta hydrolase [Actinomycetospora lutea]|uniref:alpha/beta fold hydrolase n=1 Tax=Actinomycetospora lutea TaxID=663604 RepID=UPI0023671F87|nr:alpha/beta hydrolase [Actinomycetospora lutea]MDD7937258.1 alpha/beta hydrolase [Actinomycetospora lutea]